MGALPDPFHVPDGVFCAGRRQEVLPMPAPHAHSQVELNFLLTGAMTYAIHGREVAVAAGEFAFFWGAVPHQAVTVAPSTTFVCLYVPLEMFLVMPLSARLVGAVLAGAVVVAAQPRAFEPGTLQRLHAELLEPDTQPDASLVELDRTELELMLRRVDLTGWQDRAGVLPAGPARKAGAIRAGAREKARAMACFIAAHATDPVGVADVARAAGLHPNYAMTVFREVLGMTIGGYLTRQRLHAAQQHLLAGREDVASVAFASGFGSVSRFHEAFRRGFGVTPQRFRAAALRRAEATRGTDLSAAGPAI